MSEFGLVRKYWPDRGIFQGSACAFLRYAEREHTPWKYYEKPLWLYLSRKIGFDRKVILDIGSGSGQIANFLVENGAMPRETFALEPNPILIERLHRRDLGVSCIKDSVENLDSPLLQANEFDLITANMVANHLPTSDFEKLVYDSTGVLKEGGILAYTVPDPLSKADNYCLGKDENNVIIEEQAPWGGLVECHHRSEEFQRETLKTYGFDVLTISGGYDDTYHTHIGPMRMMFIAQKGDLTIDTFRKWEMPGEICVHLECRK